MSSTLIIPTRLRSGSSQANGGAVVTSVNSKSGDVVVSGSSDISITSTSNGFVVGLSSPISGTYIAKAGDTVLGRLNLTPSDSTAGLRLARLSSDPSGGSSAQGDVYFSTNSSILALRYYDGSSWLTVGGLTQSQGDSRYLKLSGGNLSGSLGMNSGSLIHLGTRGTVPGSGMLTGSIYYNNPGQRPQVYDGTSWKNVAYLTDLPSAFPSFNSNANEFLTHDASTLSWSTLPPSSIVTKRGGTTYASTTLGYDFPTSDFTLSNTSNIVSVTLSSVRGLPSTIGSTSQILSVVGAAPTWVDFPIATTSVRGGVKLNTSDANPIMYVKSEVDTLLGAKQSVLSGVSGYANGKFLSVAGGALSWVTSGGVTNPYGLDFVFTVSSVRRFSLQTEVDGTNLRTPGLVLGGSDGVSPAALMVSLKSDALSTGAGGWLVKIDSSSHRINKLSTSNTSSDVIGVVTDVPDTADLLLSMPVETNVSQVAIAGITNVTCDVTAIAIGDYLIPSTTTAGAVHSVGATAPTTGWVGRALQAKAGGSVSSLSILLDINRYSTPAYSLNVKRNGTSVVASATALDYSTDFTVSASTTTALIGITLPVPAISGGTASKYLTNNGSVLSWNSIPPTLTVRDNQGSPVVVTGVTTLELDGFVVVNAGSGVATASYTLPSISQNLAVVLAAGFTPLATGADAFEFTLPNIPGVTPGTGSWTVTAIQVTSTSLNGSLSNSTVINLESSAATGVFSSYGTIVTATLSAGSATLTQATSGSPTIAVGNRMRLNFTALSEAHAALTVTVYLV